MKTFAFSALLALSLAGCGLASALGTVMPAGTSTESTVSEATFLGTGGERPKLDFEAFKKELFSKLDKDGDGAVSADEFKAAPPPGPGKMGPGEMGPGKHGPGAPADLTDAEKAEMEALRAEQEAKRAEAEAAFKAKYPALATRKEAEKARAEARRAEELSKAFAAMDANADGKLSADEFKPPQPPAGMHKGPRGGPPGHRGGPGPAR